MDTKTSRYSGKMGAVLEQQIAEGKLAPGELIPSVRELSRLHRLSASTVARAMRELVQTGVLRAEPRRGYRVLPRIPAEKKGAPVAYVSDPRQAGARYGTQLTEFHKAADRRGTPLLAVSMAGQTAQQVVQQLRTGNAAGVVFDLPQLDLIREVKRHQIPAVLVDDWREDVDLDSVMQDGQHGGILAVNHLLSRGHRRIAWCGPELKDGHYMDRLSGYTVACQRAGIAMELWDGDETQALALLLAKLGASDRPTGVVALWASLAKKVVQAAVQLGLKPGKEFEVVGWSIEEGLAEYRAGFPAGMVPPTLTWSARTMAEVALTRLAERRQTPDLPALRVKIPVRLVEKLET